MLGWLRRLFANKPLISDQQRQRKLEAMMRAQDERYFGSWYAR